MTAPTRRALAGAGLAVMAVVVLVIVAAGVTGIQAAWPALLGAAIGMAPGPVAGRVGAMVLGVAAGWGGLLLRVGVLPATTGGSITAAAVVVAVVVAASVATRDRIPLWASLVGAAGLLALADTGLTADPAAFPADPFATVGGMLLGAGLGVAATVLVRAAITARTGRPRAEEDR